MARALWDVVIAGAGPAGLSAALVLGRARRKILLCDTGTPRSWASKEMHGFLTRDKIPPEEFRRLAHEELGRYANVVFRMAEVTRAVRGKDGHFSVTLGKRRVVQSRKLLIATGVFDHLPAVPGIEQFFGTSVFQCPYCDGWEVRDAPVAVYGKHRRGFEMARAMTAWTRDIVLCSDGMTRLSKTERRQLRRNGIDVVEERIDHLHGDHGKLQAIVFVSGRRLARSALFFDTSSSGQSRLAESLGCQFSTRGGIKCGQYEATSVAGVFVAGNIIKDVQLAIVAAAEGTRAAFGINRALTREDFDRRP
ncbi:MAG TPA: NAD(P)/FAD-dependent oxidoreductase [Steroidobacteraceae bacterium]|nr:NAD(P)/FAD-dependent oxidoreductase [Steroidobacteraceae bacterium]